MRVVRKRGLQSMEIFTIGTSTRSIEEFLEIIKEYKIDKVLDVRRFPTSKLEHFKKEKLKDALNKEKIQYFHIVELGGYRGGYKEYVKTEEFKKGLEMLIKIAKESKAAIMCAELLFFRCHRRYISDKLLELGMEVTHILDIKRSYAHKIKSA